MRFIEDTRGSATSEGIIVAPVLVMLFAAVLWAGVRYQTERQNAAEVHRGSWAPALLGCDEGAPDPGLSEALAGYRGRLAGNMPRLRRDLDRVTIQRIEGLQTEELQQSAVLGGGTLVLTERSRIGCNTIGIVWTDDEISDITRDEFCRLPPYCDPI
jgi:hypothetical protein